MALDGALTTLSSYFFPAPFPTFFPTQLPCAWILFYDNNSGDNYKDDGQIRVELPFFKAVFYYIH